MADLAILLKEGKYSDLTLMCQDEEFKIHRNIVCAQSPVFAAAVDGGFKVCVIRSNDHLSSTYLDLN